MNAELIGTLLAACKVAFARIDSDIGPCWELEQIRKAIAEAESGVSIVHDEFAQMTPEQYASLTEPGTPFAASQEHE